MLESLESLVRLRQGKVALLAPKSKLAFEASAHLS